MMTTVDIFLSLFGKIHRSPKNFFGRGRSRGGVLLGQEIWGSLDPFLGQKRKLRSREVKGLGSSRMAGLWLIQKPNSGCLPSHTHRCASTTSLT
jgi:hypothetical protein